MEHIKVDTKYTGAVRALADALDCLQSARKATTQGFADDYCCNAINEVKKALKIEVECIMQEDQDQY